MVNQQRDVLATLAQRRKRDRQDIQPEQQVAAETALGHHGVQIMIGRDDHTHVHLDFRLTADRTHLPLLQHAQQFRLQARTDVPDLVEKKRAAVRPLKQPAHVCGGAGERALYMTEQLRIEQFLRQGTAVDRNERTACAPAGGMDGTGDHLLTGSGLSGDEHGNVLVADAFDQIEDAVHRRTSGNDVRQLFAPGEPLAQARHLLAQLLFLEHLVDAQHQLVGVDRLGEIVVGTKTHGLDCRFDRRVGSHDDALRRIRALPELRQQRHAARLAQPQVEHDHVYLAAAEHRLRRLQSVSLECQMPLRAQQHVQGLADGRFVVNDQYACHGVTSLPDRNLLRFRH